MIYLDNNATTPLAEEVLAVMEEVSRETWGNPSSIHRVGQHAKERLVCATQEIADFFFVGRDQILFTSGATEGLNMALRGMLQGEKGGEILSSTLEHVATLETLEQLKREGFETRLLAPYKGKGAITPDQIEEVVTPRTRLMTFMAVNNETGVMSDIEAFAAIAEKHQIPFVVDGVSLLGKGKLTLPKGVSAAVFSGHKIHGPRGIGVVVFQKKQKCAPLIVGGAQQGGRRGGTENLPAICGLAKALELIRLPEQEAAMQHLRDRFEAQLKAAFPNLVIHGERELRICNTSNCTFPGVEGEMLLMHLDLAGVAASHGAACSSGTLQPSHVLQGMGISHELVRSSLRFSLGRQTTEKEIDEAVQILKKQTSFPKILR